MKGNKSKSLGIFSIISALVIGILAFKVVERLRNSTYSKILTVPPKLKKGIDNEASYKTKVSVLETKSIKGSSKAVSSVRLGKKKEKNESKSIKKFTNQSIVTSNAAMVRQQKLLRYITEHKSLVMSDALKEFKNINERTLRRDLVSMVKAGVLKKSGSTKSTKYILK